MNTVAVSQTSLATQSVTNGRKAHTAVTPKADEALLRRLCAGEEAAFDELVDKHHGALIRMAMGYVADREVAEEVVQDTWLAVVESLSRFEGRSSLRTWIFSILIHKAKDRGIREKRHTTFSSFDSYDNENEEAADPSCFQQSGEWADHWAFPPQPWDEETPEKLLSSQQAVNAMNQAINGLPVTLKEVLILRDVEGAEVKEVCELLRITETNLYVRLHRARERVRQVVESYLEGSNKAL